MTQTTSFAYPVIRTVGLAGLLVTFSDKMSDAANRAAIAFRAAIDAENWPEITESAPTLVSAFFRIDLVAHPVDTMIARLHERLDERDWTEAPLPAGRKLWIVPAVFGGPRAPQLETAAEAAGLSQEAAADELAAARLRVITIGFAPGQPYLGTLGPAWDIPRLTELSRNVPRGALVAAVRQLCLFSKDTPTGWRHVGQTAFRPFQPDSADPFPLSPGDELTFRRIETDELEALERAGAKGGAEFEVLE